MENPKWQEIRCCGCCSIVKSSPTICDPMDFCTPGLPCRSLSSRICSDSHRLSWWCYLNISSCDAPFSFCPQYFPVSGSFPMSQQEIGWWAWVWPLAETPYIPPLHSPSHTCACEHTLTHTHPDFGMKTSNQLVTIIAGVVSTYPASGVQRPVGPNTRSTWGKTSLIIRFP